MGETGIAHVGADLTRIALHEVTRGRHETLRRWLQLDDRVRQLAIITADPGGLREHTPGELAASWRTTRPPMRPGSPTCWPAGSTSATPKRHRASARVDRRGRRLDLSQAAPWPATRRPRY